MSWNFIIFILILFYLSFFCFHFRLLLFPSPSFSFQFTTIFTLKLWNHKPINHFFSGIFGRNFSKSDMVSNHKEQTKSTWSQCLLVPINLTNRRPTPTKFDAKTKRNTKSSWFLLEISWFHPRFETSSDEHEKKGKNEWMKTKSLNTMVEGNDQQIPPDMCYLSDFNLARLWYLICLNVYSRRILNMRSYEDDLDAFWA